MSVRQCNLLQHQAGRTGYSETEAGRHGRRQAWTEAGRGRQYYRAGKAGRGSDTEEAGQVGR
jgi:hypothetical protein